MKKIFDILPPTKAKEKPVPTTKKIKLPFSYWWLAVIIVPVVIGAVMIIFTLQSKLVLTLKINEEPMTFEEQVEVSVSQEKLDIENKIIPGEIILAEAEKWAAFQSTGVAVDEEKAKGMITVYNSQTPPKPISLIAQTRFLSSEGEKIFRTPKRIYIPPAQIKNGKTIPGSVEIEVVAQESGEEYNIGPSQFSVPGLSGTDLYYSIWAESSANMAEGFKKEIKKITAQDIDTAKIDLEAKLVALIERELRKKASDDFVLESGLIFDKDIVVSCFEEPEEKIAEFNCEGKITAKGLVFAMALLQDLAREIISNQVSVSKKVREETLDLIISSKGLTTEEVQAVLGLKINVKMHQEINQDAILAQIKGKNREEIEETIFEHFPQIESIEFKFWPFWIRKAPSDSERIEIGLTF